MEAILLVVEMPPIPENTAQLRLETEQAYIRCTGTLRELAYKNKNFRLLGANVLLFQTDNALDVFAEVSRSLYEVPYKYIIFDEELKWHEVPKKV